MPGLIGRDAQMDGERVSHEAATMNAEKAVATPGHMAVLTTDSVFGIGARAPLIVGVFEKEAIEAVAAFAKLMTTATKSTASKGRFGRKAIMNDATGRNIGGKPRPKALIVAHMAVCAGDALVG